MVDIFLFTINIIICYLIIYKPLKNKKLLSPEFGFVAGALVYLVLYSFEVSILYRLNVSRYSQYVNYSTEIAFITTLYLLGFFSSLKFNKILNIPFNSNIKFLNPDDKFIKFNVYIWLGATIFFFYFYYDQIFNATYFNAAVDRVNNLSFAVYVLLFQAIGVLVFCFYLRSQYPVKYSLAILFLIIYFGFITYDKNPIILAMISALTILIDKYKSVYKLIFITTMAALLFLLFIPFFSYYRADVNFLDSLAAVVDLISLTAIDTRGPYQTIISCLSSKCESGSFVNSIAILIPNFLFPGERPPDHAILFAMQNISNWRPGLGLGFSPVTEGLLLFGYPGVFLTGFFLGFITNLIWYLFFKFSNNKKTLSSLHLLYSILSFYVMLLSFRSPVAGTIKLLVLQLFAVYLFIMLSSTMSRIKI
jgi:hypothetical protein